MSGKINLKDTPSDELWRRLQDKIANKFCGVTHDELTEREKRIAFVLFVRELKAQSKKTPGN